MKNLLISVSVLSLLSTGAALADAPVVQNPGAIDTRIPLQYVAAQGGTMSGSGSAPASSSDFFFRMRADIGITSYTSKLTGLDAAALNGFTPNPTVPANATTRPVYSSATTTDISDESALLDVRGFPSRTYGEATVGFNAASGLWYGDFYYRTALTNHAQTGSVTYRNASAYTSVAIANGATLSSNTSTSNVTATSKSNFYRDQFAVTLGRSFAQNWSGYIAYRYSQVRSSHYASATIQQSQVSTPTGSTTSTNIVLTAQTTPTGANAIRTRLETQGPAVGIGYANAAGPDGEHVFSAGVGAAYSFAKLRQTIQTGFTPVTALTVNGNPVTPGASTPTNQDPQNGTSLGSPKALGVWGNIGYQYYLLDNLAITLAGDGYWFSYGSKVRNNGGTDVGKLNEVSLSGRVGVAFLF